MGSDSGTSTGRDGADDKALLSGHDIERELLEDWRVMFGALHARFRTGDFATGLELVNRIGAAAEEANHHPDLDLSYGTVEVRLSSHDVGGVTQRDIRMARRVSDYAGQLSAAADTRVLSVLELALDTPDASAVAPFWAALLGYDRRGSDEEPELVDPFGRRPTIWFQTAEAATGSEQDPQQDPEQRFHLDVRVPPEVAEQRVRDAVEAGGTLVSDGRAPAFWVLADSQGNRACVTTWLDRD